MKYCEKCLAKNGNFDFFCYDITSVLWLFLPERERVTLQTSCGAEKVDSSMITICNDFVIEEL